MSQKRSCRSILNSFFGRCAASRFGRARMSAVYRYIRGVDPTTGEADRHRIAKERWTQLDDAAKECMESNALA